MCKALKPCVKGSKQDCEDCFKYSKKVFSPNTSFNFNGKVCDCIISCDGYYILVEIKTGRLYKGEAEDAIEQLKNCEKLLREKCEEKLKCCKKVLIYGKFERQPGYRKRIENILESEEILFYRIESLNSGKIKLC